MCGMYRNSTTKKPLNAGYHLHSTEVCHPITIELYLKHDGSKHMRVSSTNDVMKESQCGAITQCRWESLVYDTGKSVTRPEEGKYWYGSLRP
jgi:hypothetical protein